MSNPSAKKEGENLLQKFREGRSKTADLNASRISNDEEENTGYFEAVVDGSRLAMAYSETKRKESRSFLLSGEDDDTAGDGSPLDMIRNALLKLKSMSVEGKVDDNETATVSAMLQNVEEYLEKAVSSRSRVSARLAYSAEKRSRPDFFEEDSNLDNEPYTPTRLDRSGQFKQRSVYMENQLDLNESEMEYYEHIINDLADKLEKEKEEKDDLQAISSSLGDRLQRLGREKEEALEDAQRELDAVRDKYQAFLDTLHHEVASSKQALDAERQKCVQLTDQLDGRDQRISQLQLADEKHKLYVRDLENSLQLESRSVDTLKRSVTELQERLRLEEGATEQLKASVRLSVKDSADSEVEAELRRQIEDLQVELEDNKDEFDHLTAIIEDLRNRDESAPASADEVAQLQAELARVSESLALLQTEHEQDQERNRRLQQQIDTHNHERLLFGAASPGSLSHLTPGKNLSSTSNSFHMTKDTSLRFEEIDSQHRVVFTPVRSSATKALNQSQSARSLLKVCMANQLDLNESELQYYEEVVNGLVEQVETLTAELKTSQASQLEAQEAIRDLEALVANKSRELDDLRTQLSSLTLLLREREAALANRTPLDVQSSNAHQSAAGVDLTNNFLGISSAAESDSEEDGAGENAPKVTNASWSSFVSAADESFYQRGDVEELKRQLSHREQQVKVQISQLQALQDSLSEERASNNALKQQKAGFKKAVEDAKTQTELLAQKERTAWTQLQEMELRMQREVDLSTEYRRSREEADHRVADLQRTVAELQSKAAEYRMLLDSRPEHSQSAAKDSWETPNRSRNSLLLDESMHSTVSSMTPLKQRLNRTEAQVDDLNAQLRLANQAREEVQLELEKLQIRCQTKTRQAEELSREIQGLREEVDGRLEELDRLKLQDMKKDAAQRLREIDFESEVEQLRESIAALESSEVELRGALDLRESDLQHERDTNESLRRMLEKMGEKDDTTEDFLAELRVEHNQLASRLSSSHEELQLKSAQLVLVEDRCEELKQQLLESEEVAHRKERDYEQRREALEREAHLIKDNMDSFHEDSESHLAVLRRQLEALSHEKADLDATATAQKSALAQLEREVALKSSEVIKSQRAVADVAEIVVHHQTRLHKLEESLTSQIKHKMASFDSRVHAAANFLDALVARDCITNPESAVSQEMVAAALRESQAALKRALARHEEDDAEKEALWVRLQEARNELNAVSVQYDDARQLLNERNNMSRTAESEAVISPDEYARLTERLAEAEQRAVQMSTEGAKAFARSAKNMAYLEGECSRLKALVDHFRVVNTKLSGDLNSAHAEGMQSRSLEHRVKLLVQDETLLKERLVSMEAVLAKKDRELLENMRLTREQDEKRSLKFEGELDRMNELLRLAQDKMAALKKTNDDLRVAALETETSLRTELAQASDDLRRAEKEAAAYLSRCEDSEFELRRLTSTISEKDHQTSQAEVKVLMLKQEVDASRETQQTVVRDLSAEVAEKQSRILALEGGVSSLKSRLVDLEAQAMQREEEQAIKMLKYASCEKENRELRLASETLSDELSALHIKCDEQQFRFNELLREHETLRESHSILKNDTLRKTAHRLEVAEADLSRETEQHAVVAKELASHREALESCRTTLQRTETTLHNLQAEHIKTQTDEQVGRATNESLSEENEYLRRQVEELAAKVTSTAREASVLRADLAVRTEDVEELTQQVGDLETRLRNTKARLAALDDSESRLAGEMRSFAESTLIQHSTTTTTTSVSSSSSFNINKDLFASPPLVVGRGPLSTFTSEIDVRSGNSDKDTLGQVRHSFSAMRTKFESLATAYNSVHESQERLRNEKDELKRAVDKAQDRLALVKADRDGLAAKLQISENDVGEVRRLKADVEHERDELVSSLESTAQRTSFILRDLDSTLLEALAKANDAVAGIVPIDTDALPNLSISQSIIRHDDAKALRKSETASAVAVLSSSVSEVDRATAYLVSVIHSLVSEHKARKLALEKVEAGFEAKERSWVKERITMAERSENLQKEVETVHHKHSHALVEVESCRLELERIKHHLADATRNNGELEGEFKSTLDSNAELRATLGEAETLCMELRSRLRVQQGELDKKIDECSVLSEQLEVARKRATDSELQHEKTSALLGRVRAEKDALDNVRRCLDSELERSRAEVTSLRESSKQFDEGNSAFFEAEKLLAGLGSSLDQILPAGSLEPLAKVAVTSTGSPVKDSSLVRASDNFTFASPSLHMTSVQSSNAQTLSQRVELALKRLSLLNAVKRDEARSRRALEGQLDTLTQDAAAAHRASEESHQQLRRALVTSAERETELKDKMREISALQLESQRQKEEAARLKREAASLSESLEAERKAHQKYLLDLQSRDTDASRLHHELESRSIMAGKLQEQLNATKQQLQEMQQECDHRAEQLRSAKGNMDRVMATVEQLERGAENDKRERQALERKLIESENTNATVSRLKTRVHELEQNLSKATEECRSLTHAKVLEEESQQRSAAEMESYRKKVHALEGRIESILQEKNSFADEISETRRKIALAKESAEQERVQRLRSEAAVEALRRAGEDKRFYLEDFKVHTEEIQSREAQAEEEKRSLRQKLNQLREISDEKEAQYLAEAHDRAKLEGDIKQLKSALAKRNLELNTSSNYSASLRSEGRNARKLILEAVGQIREIVNIVRIDAQSAGHSIASPEPKSKPKGRTAQGGDFAEETLSLGLAEALGIPDLSSSLDALKDAVTFLRAAPRNRHEMEAVLRSLTQENETLRIELQDCKTKRHELATQCKHQIHTMQLELTDMRRSDSKNPHLTHQIGELEASLRHEKDRKEKALSEVEALKSRLEHLTQEAATHRHSHSSHGSFKTEIDALRTEIDRQKVEYAQLAKELEAVNHHRTVLRDTVDQLDKQVRQRSEEAADWQVRAEAAGGGSSSVDEDALRRQVARYKARAVAATEIANTYRVSVLALYADGASYGAAQFGWQAHGLPQEFNSKSVHLIGVGWIEREISTVRHSFEDEIRLLDSEVSELRAKLRQSNSYIVELRKRFEDNIKSVYRSGKGSQDGGLQHFEHMKAALDNAEGEVASLQADLASEKSRGRKRHLQLVEDLTKTLQARDAALSALRRLEKVCVERGVDIHGLAIYETLKSELASTTEAVERWRSEESASSEQHRAINTMMRGLVETDHELAETERRAARQLRERQHSQHHSRSSSHGNSAMRSESANNFFSHSSSAGHTGRSPPKQQKEAGDGVSDRLTDSFLTNKSGASGLHHEHKSDTRQSGIPVGRSSSTSRLSRDGGTATQAPAQQQNVSSYQLQTVGHNSGSGSLRVTKATTQTVNTSYSSIQSSSRASGHL